MNEQNFDQNQPQAPSPEKGISTITGLLITLLVAVIAGAGIWYYFNYYFSPDLEKSSTENQVNTPTEESAGETSTESETADWKTYTNTTYGFSFKYPTTWEARDITSSNTHIENLLLFIGANPSSHQEDTFFNVRVENNSIESELLNLDSGDNHTITKKEITKYGITATEVTNTNQTTGYSSTSYYIGKDSKTYIITGVTNNPSDEAKIGNQISESFQFTK